MIIVFIMQAPSFTNTALALCLTVAGAFPVAAQQMASNTTAAEFAACDKIKSAAQSAQCYSDASLNDAKRKLVESQARLTQANGRLAQTNGQLVQAQAGLVQEQAGLSAEQTLLRCANFLKAKKAEGVVIDPARFNREKGCGYAAELGLK